jgi:iron complex transport system substrate-binding protein
VTWRCRPDTVSAGHARSRSRWYLVWLTSVALTVGVSGASATISVRDDAGRAVRLARPAQRIVSLAPHVTELLFAAGAGPAIVGVSEHSDFPQAARQIPRIGNASGFDIERIVSLRPDLIVAWRSGNPPRLLQRFLDWDIPVFMSEPRRLEDIPSDIVRLGQLAGTGAAARRASVDFHGRYDRLRSRYSRLPPVTVFFQIWQQPLMTINGTHLISDVIRLCGGINVFAQLPTLTPLVDVEAVLQAQPQAIVATGGPGSDALAAWRRWPELEAVRLNHLFLIPDELIARQSPRVLAGAELLCKALERTRAGSRSR